MTTIDLPDYDNWVGTDGWRDHLLGDHFDHPREGCPACAVGPFMPKIHYTWQNGTHEQIALIWSLQDGYGTPGYLPGQGYDWSGVRDSSPAAIRAIYDALTGGPR